MKNILIAFFLLFPSILFAQNNLKSLTGIIVDAQTYEPLPFANIIVLETNFGTTSNTNGEFKIDNVSILNQLRISYVGYTSQLVRFK